MLDQDTTRSILDSVRNGSQQHKELLQEWESKTPEEQVAACRQIVYGIVGPVLAGTDPESVPEVEAIFEATFKNVERSTQRSSASSRRSSSS